MEGDVTSDTEPRKRAEGAVADQAKHGDSCFAKRVYAGSTSSNSFGIKAEFLALPRRDDFLVDKGAEAPKPHLPPVEDHLSLADFLLEPRRDQEKYQPDKQPACPPYQWRVIQMDSRLTLVFNPGGTTVRLSGCPFLGGRHALRIGWAFLDAAMVAETGIFLVHRGVEHHFQESYKQFVTPYVLRFIAVSLEAKLIRGAVKIRRHEVM